MGLDKKYRGQAISVRKEIAKVVLEKYVTKHDALYRGIPISEYDFGTEELLKIIDMYAGLIKSGNAVIAAHI